MWIGIEPGDRTVVRLNGIRCQLWADRRTRELSYGERRPNDEDVIAKEVKCAVKDLVATGLVTMIEESLDYILRKLLYNVQSVNQSVA